MYSAYKLNKQGDNIQPWRTPFPTWNQSVVPCPVPCPCCFLTCIQISQEAGQVVRYSHLFQNFPQFIVIHTVKGFSIVNKAEVDVFLELPSFLHDPKNVGNLISGVSLFQNPTCTSGNSWFMYCWSLTWRILSKTLLACEVSTTLQWSKHCVALTFFGIGMKNWPFPILYHYWVFQICWHIEYGTFTSLFFKIWNSSDGSLLLR